AQFAAPGQGEADDAGFGGHVVGLAEVAVEADHGTGVQDDAAALSDHAGNDGLGGIEDALQVPVDHRVELRLGHFLEAGIAGDACVVHQDVDASEPVQDGFDGPIHAGPVRDVGRDADGGCAGGAAVVERLLHGVFVYVAGDDRCAFLRELDGGRCADSAAGACDQCDPVL